MVERLLTRAGARGWPTLSAPLRIGILYLAARAVTTGFLILAASLAGPGSRFGPNATIGSFLLGWDAQWYWLIAVSGYPTELPLTESGVVSENQWAFMPVYPYLARIVGLPFEALTWTGAPGWGVGAVFVSLVAGYLACLVLYRMLRMRIDATAATWAALFFAAGPLAALFHVGYAESLFLLWLFLSLWLVQQRRFGWLYLLIPLMGFTRPGVLAFALFLGLYGIWRWLRRRHDALPRRQVVHIVALGLLAVVVGFSWQVFAAIATGRADAYLATELAWRRTAVSAEGFIPFGGFLEGTAMWFGRIWNLGEATGYVVLAASVLAIAALLLFEPHVRRLGVETRLWTASYLVYLLAVFFPQSSIFRLLVPVSPLWGAIALPRSTAYRVAVLGACLVGQWWWIYNMYALANTAYWTIP
ncbi:MULTISPECIES: mannosyltransferase family protein [unclassified Microbacterium]|uniref:mannosyltransferase family protein n=1 Tax=unclassified Microbacterium TaxID=2609290 RepID=UPI00214BF189|nr:MULTISPECIES: mannosyltransferase family protein [unclassified Microbacterium]MCR2809768.1 hypothetical protein [Microbacterium sp. zg.B185]WIM17921.1 mannosyltransferase family protein [Microbacterium sp. zg-B185]